MKILICGSRKFNDQNFFNQKCDEILSGATGDIEIVSGAAKGADAFAEEYAHKKNLKLKVFPAEWNKYGRRAGPLRNIQMLDYLADDAESIVIGFIYGESKGTKFTLGNAEKRNYTTIVISYDENDNGKN